MRMLFEGGPNDAFSSIIASDISVYVSFSIMVATTGLVYYVLAEVLDWSSNKPAPRVVRSPAFNFLFVSSAMAITILLLRGTDLIGIFSMATEPIVCLVEDYGPVVTVGLVGIIMLIVVQWLRAR